MYVGCYKFELTINWIKRPYSRMPLSISKVDTTCT